MASITPSNNDNNNDNINDINNKVEEDESPPPVLPSSLDDWQEGHENDMSTIRDCYCPNCQGGTAITTLLPTKVPMFREIIVMTLVCSECYFRNSEVTFGGQIQERGERITLHVSNSDDLNRQVIKSDSATLMVPQLELEIPPGTQRGTVSTIEGMLKRAAETLQGGQAQRLALGDVDNFHRCRHVIEQLNHLGNGGVEESNDDDEVDKVEGDNNTNNNSNTKTSTTPSFPEFDIILDDPAGNSYLENLHAPHPDPAMTHTKYTRTAMQDMSLGLQPSAQALLEGTIDNDNPMHKNIVNGPGGVATIEPTINKDSDLQQSQQQQQQQHHGVEIDEQVLLNMKKKQTGGGGAGGDIETSPKQDIDNENDNNNDDDDDDDEVGRQEVIKFTTACPHCYKTAETDMCVTDIPHFKEVIIMSLYCQACGYKSNEIKGGGAIPKFGCKITVTIQSEDDLAREVLKSDTAGIEIPELELELEEGGLDGMYTTIEGLMKKLHDRLKEANPFGAGDAAKKQHLTNDTANAFSAPSPNHARYLQFLHRLDEMGQGNSFPFTLVISDPLANSFIGPIPQDAIALAMQAERDGRNECYNAYVDHGMVLQEYERSFEQNEILGLNDMKTENYAEQESHHHDQEQQQQQHQRYYGTDLPEEVPDRIRRVDIRGPDHPHVVGKAPVEGDTTIMGAGSLNFAVPSIGQRGAKSVSRVATTSNTTAAEETIDDGSQLLRKLIHDKEYNDQSFMMNDEYEGPNKGMVFKDGAQGLGYYMDVPLLQLYEEHQRERSDE